MSDQPPPPPPAPAPGPNDPREAKANAKAAKAHAKAMRPWYKKKRFIIPLGLVGLIIIASLAGGGDDDGSPSVANEPDNNAEQTEPDSQETQAEEPEPEPEGAGIGDAVRDGKFEFVVTDLECGVAEVGEEFFAEEASGEFCLLHLTVENIGNEAQFMFADNQVLIDDQGREFSASSEASFAYDTDGKLFADEINPGIKVEGVVVFDVPVGATIARAELHDSAFSGGVDVNLA